MKTVLHLLTFAALALATSQTVLATNPPRDLPDGGATAVLLGIGAVGLVAARNFIGKK